MKCALMDSSAVLQDPGCDVEEKDKIEPNANPWL